MMFSLGKHWFLVLLFVLFLLVGWIVYLQVPKLSTALSTNQRPTPAVATSSTPTPSEIISGVEPPLASPSVAPTPSPAVQSYFGQLNLIVPVAGINREQLVDTFSEARADGRSHDAIDIVAPQGTPVLAATDGRIVKLFQSDRGGTTIYQLASNEKLVLYYAHLQRYADGLTEGMSVRQGQLLAYVGDTGNAIPGNFHLHFSIAVVPDPHRYWEGTNINPYPILRGQ